jgi:hypothetical protein
MKICTKKIKLFLKGMSSIAHGFQLCAEKSAKKKHVSY